MKKIGKLLQNWGANPRDVVTEGFTVRPRILYYMGECLAVRLRDLNGRQLVVIDEEAFNLKNFPKAVIVRKKHVIVRRQPKKSHWSQEVKPGDNPLIPYLNLLTASETVRRVGIRRASEMHLRTIGGVLSELRKLVDPLGFDFDFGQAQDQPVTLAFKYCNKGEFAAIGVCAEGWSTRPFNGIPLVAANSSWRTNDSVSPFMGFKTIDDAILAKMSYPDVTLMEL